MAKPTLREYQDALVSVTDFYTLTVTAFSNKTSIVMKLLIPEVNTKDFPQTSKYLKLHLPSIFSCTCYNDANLPFHKELISTEVGHLFEHILLEFLCLIKMERGFDNAIYEGVTDWNWVRDPKGTFHITIYTTQEEIEIFNEALAKTVTLINTILSKENIHHSSLQSSEQVLKH